MKPRHAITPTDCAPANPLWERSKPIESPDGRSVWVDAMALPEAVAYQAGVDARNAKGRA